MPEDLPRRSESESLRERTFLERRIVELEKSMGRVAAQSSGPTPIGQDLGALDRARQLTGDMLRQVRLRTLPEAIDAQLDWLGRVEARQGRDDGEPKTDFSRIALDRRLLADLRKAWLAEGN